MPAASRVRAMASGRAHERQDEDRPCARSEQQAAHRGERADDRLRPPWPAPPPDRQGAALSGGDDGEQADDEQRPGPRELGVGRDQVHPRPAATPTTAPPTPKPTTTENERNTESRRTTAGAGAVARSINGDDPARQTLAGVTLRRGRPSPDRGRRRPSSGGDVGEVVRPGVEDHGPAGEPRRVEPVGHRPGGGAVRPPTPARSAGRRCGHRARAPVVRFQCGPTFENGRVGRQRVALAAGFVGVDVEPVEPCRDAVHGDPDAPCLPRRPRSGRCRPCCRATSRRTARPDQPCPAAGSALTRAMASPPATAAGRRSS